MAAIVAFDNTTFFPGNDDIDISKFSLLSSDGPFDEPNPRCIFKYVSLPRGIWLTMT